MEELTFYIGVHDKENNFTHENIFKIDMDKKKAGELMRALKEIFNYLTVGD